MAFRPSQPAQSVLCAAPSHRTGRLRARIRRDGMPSEEERTTSATLSTWPQPMLDRGPSQSDISDPECVAHQSDAARSSELSRPFASSPDGVDRSVRSNHQQMTIEVLSQDEIAVLHRHGPANVVDLEHSRRNQFLDHGRCLPGCLSRCLRRTGEQHDRRQPAAHYGCWSHIRSDASV